MTIRRRETTSFEVYEGNVGEYIIEFACPQCQTLLAAQTENIEGGFNIACDNCKNVIQCHFKLMLEWVDDD